MNSSQGVFFMLKIVYLCKYYTEYARQKIT
nr:MAG TPA: hypothetical protein [Caudoviricetes sp.]